MYSVLLKVTESTDSGSKLPGAHLQTAAELGSGRGFGSTPSALSISCRPASTTVPAWTHGIGTMSLLLWHRPWCCRGLRVDWGETVRCLFVEAAKDPVEDWGCL